MTDFRAAFESLDTKVRAAERRAKEVRLAARSPEDAGRDLLAPLTDYHRGVTYKRRRPDRAEEGRLVRELLAEVQRDGVSLVPVDPTVAAKGLRVLDRREQLAVAKAEAAANEVRRERDRFAAQHADDLAAEESDAEMERIREALAGRDPDALRRELAGVT